MAKKPVAPSLSAEELIRRNAGLPVPEPKVRRAETKDEIAEVEKVRRDKDDDIAKIKEQHGMELAKFVSPAHNPDVVIMALRNEINDLQAKLKAAEDALTAKNSEGGAKQPASGIIGSADDDVRIDMENKKIILRVPRY